MLDFQTNLHDFQGKELPEIYSENDKLKVLNALKNPKLKRRDVLNEWTIRRNVLIFLLSYECALRPKEALNIKLFEINIAEGIIHIDPLSNKLRKGRDIYLNQKIWYALRQYIPWLKRQFWNQSPYLFPSTHNGPMSTDRWSEILRSARIQAGIYHPMKKTAYHLRHTKATETYLKTKDIEVVRNILGHATYQSTYKYMKNASLKKGYGEYMRQALT